MIVKTGLHKSGKFCQRKRSFSAWMNSSKLFPDFQQTSFEFWKQIGKIVILSVRITFFRKFVCKKIQFDNFLQNSVGFFLEFWKELTTFSGKLSGRLSERVSTFPEVLFEERHVFPKTFPRNKSFQTFSIILVFCSFLACLSKRRPCVQMTLLGNISFEQIIVYEFFSGFVQNFVVLWKQHFNRLSKMRFICLDYFFHGDFFCLEDYKQLDRFYRKSRILSS